MEILIIMSTQKYYEELEQKETIKKKKAAHRKRAKKSIAAEGSGEATKGLKQEAKDELKKERKKIKEESKRNKALIRKYGKHAAKSRSFMTSSRKGEGEKSNAPGWNFKSGGKVGRGMGVALRGGGAVTRG